MEREFTSDVGCQAEQLANGLKPGQLEYAVFR